MNGKTLAAAVSLEHGAFSCEGTGALSNRSRIEVDTTASPTVVRSESNLLLSAAWLTPSVTAGQTNIRFQGSLWAHVFPGQAVENQGDVEGVTVTLSGPAAGCQLLFRDFDANINALESFTIETPNVGEAITAANPVRLTMERKWVAVRDDAVALSVDLSAGCNDGDQVDLTRQVEGTNPAINNSLVSPLLVQSITCREGAFVTTAVQVGELVNGDYNTVAFNSGGAVIPGHFFGVRLSSFGANPLHSVDVDASYVVQDVPAGSIFRGVR